MPESKRKLYFIGNIFNSANEEITESHQEGFGFTNAQKQCLSLEGLPIRIEHNDQLRVGTIRRSWYNKASNKRWVVGDISRDDFKGVFAANGVEKHIYGGLSLQHLAVPLRNGEHVMIPVEVSIVEDPRRINCNIVAHKASQTGETTNRSYLGTPFEFIKFIMAQDKNTSETATTSAAPAAPAAPATPAAPVEIQRVEASAAGEAVATPNVNDLCQMVLELQQDKDALERRFTSQANELTLMKQQRASAQEEHMNKERIKAQCMKQSIIEWCDANGVELTEDTRNSLQTLAQEHPELGNVAFSIAHEASKKATQLQKEVNENAVKLRDQVNRVYAQRMQSRGPTTSAAPAKDETAVATAAPAAAALTATVYEASNRGKRRAPSDVYSANNQHLLQAFKRSRTSNTRANMDAIYGAYKKRFA